ncbi:GntR family transcriptional regulator [Bacillus salipaludis]|uniref:GntR family transcriptional regulator n=1 Tax=Bacillus salipaludis TaxID=2547811 RepID=A0A4R5VZI1_9BACI|nr:GntR family transcriptional regulator [Bacillus salipaludis]MDQ6595156.1 GntR family transcriptional regulator [Bacillus salipaludis]TDK63987.1 GntR family transcriptional regulator [Bacillus salipaludis]
MLKQDNQIPLYIQLKESIRSSILNGQLKFGDQIPTELELSEEYKISRITVRKAILDLVEEGYLVKKQGKGTFVNKRKIERKIVHFLSFTDACKANGMKASSKVFKKEIIQPTPKDKERLQLDEGDALLFIQRVRYADESPIMIENNYFSYKDFHSLLNENLDDSVYKILEEKLNVKPDRAGELTLEIVRATEEEVNLLHTSSGEPLFYMETTVYDENDRPVHIGKQYILGDSYKYNLK